MTELVHGADIVAKDLESTSTYRMVLTSLGFNV